jgi:GTP-binding protein
MSIKVLSAEFVGGYTDIDALANPTLPEIAIVGRSNVGKSSFLNRLTGRKKLARTSSNPGQTRQLNFFKVKISNEGKAHELFLVDLPGFGFAKLSKAEREKLAAWTVLYLTSGRPIKTVLLLNDCRRLPQVDELALQDIVFKAGLSFQVILTKADKLGKNELREMWSKIAKAYSLDLQDLILAGESFSVEEPWLKALSASGMLPSTTVK